LADFFTVFLAAFLPRLAADFLLDFLEAFLLFLAIDGPLLSLCGRHNKRGMAIAPEARHP
jgi:hypothetical protein